MNSAAALLGGILFVAAGNGAAAANGSTGALWPWASPDGRVILLRPENAVLSFSDTGYGPLVPPGWRLDWDAGRSGAAPSPGRVVVRLTLQAIPKPPDTAVTEVLQLGVSRDAQAVATCLTAGLDGGNGRRLPDRIINGRRFGVWTNSDAGMSHAISATDLRTVVDGACYAVERFTYSVSASDPDPRITLPQRSAAKALDAALASLRLEPAAAAHPSTPRTVTPADGRR